MITWVYQLSDWQLALIAVGTIAALVIACIVGAVLSIRRKRRMDRLYDGDYEAWKKNLHDLRSRYR